MYMEHIFYLSSAYKSSPALCLLSAILSCPGGQGFPQKNISILKIKSKIHLIIPIFIHFPYSFLEKAPFWAKINPPQNSKNALFFSKFMKKCVPEIPAARKTLEIIPSGNSTGSSPAGRRVSPGCTGEVASVGGRRGQARDCLVPVIHLASLSLNSRAGADPPGTSCHPPYQGGTKGAIEHLSYKAIDDIMWVNVIHPLERTWTSN